MTDKDSVKIQTEELAPCNECDDDSSTFSEDSLSELKSGDGESDTTGDLASLDSGTGSDTDDDMTDVSPLSSCNASPIPGASSPTHNNHNQLRVRIKSPECEPVQFSSPEVECISPSDKEVNVSEQSDMSEGNDGSAVDFRLLSQVVTEMESDVASCNSISACNSNRPASQTSNSSTVSSRPSVSSQSRRNMSFSNDKVWQIDRENQRLLNSLIRVGHNRKRERHLTPPPKMSSSAVNRLREQRRIELENQARLSVFMKIYCFPFSADFVNVLLEI